MAIRPPHHPPIPGTISRPVAEGIGYIYGSSGAVGGFGGRDFYVAAIPRKIAVETITRHHYSKRIVNNSYVHLGVFIDGTFAGVHPMLLTAHKKGGKRGAYLRENLGRATSRKLRQFRYIFFLKPSARRDLKMRIHAYPKP